jgi:hypothetical protein
MMVRRVTPAQLQSMMRQAQQQQRQAVANYNREVDRVNAHNKRVVDERNRNVKQAVTNYNREVTAHNSQVRANHQRLKNEVARLNSRPTTSSTRYVTYNTAVATLQQSFTNVETSIENGVWSDDHNFLDLTEGETANSVAVLNQLLADPAEATMSDDASLRQTSLTNELSDIAPDLEARWTGALFALSPMNPDAARHFCTSAREIMTVILDVEAPDRAVRSGNPTYLKTPNGSVSRRAKILYCLERSGNYSEALAEFVDDDVNSVITLFNDFNHGTHGNAGQFDLQQLTAIKTRVEGAIQFLHRVVR